MQYTNLGATNIRVSRICVGCMSFGKPAADFQLWTLDPEQSERIIGYALDQGINFFDTANVYAHGTSEEYLARALKNLKVPRDKVVIASKVYFNEGHLSRPAILREIDGTLKRLNTDYLDLYQIHRFDYDTPMLEIMSTLDELVRAGKVRALGASAMYGYQFHNLQLTADSAGLTRFSTLQNHYNLLYREDERELIPVARQYGVSLIPYSPLASGHLCHREWDYATHRAETDPVRRGKYDRARAQDEKIVARVAEIADRHGVEMPSVALAWLLARGVAAPIVGATRAEHFAPAIKAVDLWLTAEEIQYLEELYTAHEMTGAIPVPRH